MMMMINIKFGTMTMMMTIMIVQDDDYDKNDLRVDILSHPSGQAGRPNMSRVRHRAFGKTHLRTIHSFLEGKTKTKTKKGSISHWPDAPPQNSL